jgi:N-carbamoylputrescine amidase
MQKLAKELGVVIPVSFFEEANNAHYNSIAIIDADGTDLGIYRKSHIPDGPGMQYCGYLCDVYYVYIIANYIISSTGYEEKFYFNPGDTGFKVGVGIALIDSHCFE